jgi:DNA-binding CsgD family transcriptional regulator
MRLSVEQFSELVASVHEAAAAPDRWPSALSIAVRHFGASSAALLDIAQGTDDLLAFSAVGKDPATQKLYAENYFSIDPTWGVCLAAPHFQSLTAYENFPRRTRDRNEYFDFCRSRDIGDVIGVSTSPFAGQRALISLQRPVTAEPFGHEEKTFLNLLAPHLERAKRVETRLTEALRANLDLGAAFDQLAAAVFIVDGRARVRHQNASATSMLKRYRGIRGRDGRLSFADPQTNAAVGLALKQAVNRRGRAQVLALPREIEEGGEILIAPLHPEHALASAWEIPLALVAIMLSPRDTESIALRLQQLYRLSGAESGIVAALAMGDTVEHIARARRVSEATLRSQLRSIFNKTGTSRQADLVRLALVGADFVRRR